MPEHSMPKRSSLVLDRMHSDTVTCKIDIFPIDAVAFEAWDVCFKLCIHCSVAGVLFG